MGIATAQTIGNYTGMANAMYLDVLKQAYAEVSSQVSIKPKHQEWFSGKIVSNDSPDSLERRVAQALAKRMVAQMEGIGTMSYDSFASKMSAFRHEMQKSIVPGLIPGHITHGVCRIGQVVDVERTSLEVVRFFVTSGEVDIDPDKGAKYLSLVDRTVDKRMFYGIALTLNRDGSFIQVNKDRFDDGVAFLTDDPKEALFNMSAASTGRPVELFRNMASAAAGRPMSAVPNVQSPSQPKF